MDTSYCEWLVNDPPSKIRRVCPSADSARCSIGADGDLVFLFSATLIRS
jgi:hypothetical protein